MKSYGLIHPRLLTELTPNFYPSRCTLYAATVTVNSFGAEVLVLTAVTGLIDLACRIAPKSTNESRQSQQTVVEGVMDVTLAGYYRAITHLLTPVIDGVSYAMEGEPEWDGNAKTTRFEVRVVE